MIDENLYKIREEKIDNVEKWLWLKKDTGAWDGPKRDWETTHKEKILKHVTKFDVVVQAGGNQGMYPRLLSDMFKTVYTFEPSHMNFFTLCYNCKDKDNIVIMNAALGDVHKMVGIGNLSDVNTGVHQVMPQEKGIIPQLKIDDLDLPECDLIYLDIESYEKYAILGAMETIKKFKPIIFAENGGSIADVIVPLGYDSVDQSHSDTVYACKG